MRDVVGDRVGRGRVARRGLRSGRTVGHGPLRELAATVVVGLSVHARKVDAADVHAIALVDVSATHGPDPAAVVATWTLAVERAGVVDTGIWVVVTTIAVVCALVD